MNLEPPPRFNLQMLDTAKHRAAQLRQAAINDALDTATRAPAALLRAAWQRLFHRRAAPCRS